MLYELTVGPFVQIAQDFPHFFFEVVISGLLTGVMYSLVALGFVLIFKASGVFNFAQGVMALFAGLTLVGLMDEFGFPAWLAIGCTLVVMFVLAVAIERWVLRPLVNQEPIVLFMATLGLAFILEGTGDLIWGSSVRVVDIGIPQGANAWLNANTGLYVENTELFAALIAGTLVAGLAYFLKVSRMGRQLRAVADDNQAAMSIGISLRNIWIMVWAGAGLIALVAGAVWGTKSGVQFSLSLIALKALPVLILGGFTSIPGAIVGGLIIGLSEKIAEIYWGPALGGAIENWFAFVLALIFLLFRPQGLFGDKIIERI